MTAIAISTTERVTRYQPGEVVGIAIEYATVLSETATGVMIRTKGGFVFNVPVLTGPKPEIAIVRQLPHEGAPKLGDVWADTTGHQYFVISPTRVVNSNGHQGDFIDVHRGKYGPLHLVYRNGSVGAGV